MEPRILEQRLRILQAGDYHVLPLGEALQRLYGKELPHRSVSIRSDALLLRFIDTTGRSELDFESWLTGVGDWLAIRRAARRKYVPPRRLS
jgi:hypothetical protein